MRPKWITHGIPYISSEDTGRVVNTFSGFALLHSLFSRGSWTGYVSWAMLHNQESGKIEIVILSTSSHLSKAHTSHV